MKGETAGRTLSRGAATVILAALLLVATWNYLDRAARSVAGVLQHAAVAAHQPLLELEAEERGEA